MPQIGHFRSNIWVGGTWKHYFAIIHTTAIEQYFHVALFIKLYKTFLTFKPVNETQVCDHLIESYWAVLACGTVYYAVQGGSNF